MRGFMYSKVISGGVRGVQAYTVEIEVDVSSGLPAIDMVGLLNSEVKEARERVRASIKNMNVMIPPRRITVNLSPAHIRKRGTLYDFPIAVGILASLEVLSQTVLYNSCFIGELSLDGRLLPVNGVLPIIIHAKEEGIDTCYIPSENIREVQSISGVQVVPVESLKQMLDIFMGEIENGVIHNVFHNKTGKSMEYQTYEKSTIHEEQEYSSLDFSQVQGQKMAKRGIEIAVSGRHNLLFVGTPGSGKSMLSKRIPTILPKLTEDEVFEVSKIYSIAGMLNNKSLVRQPPFRTPHHTITPQALAGGGRYPKPGEVTLAHKGILFLDEFPEFKAQTLEILRQPLEDKTITISRLQEQYEFPADFILVAAMNPCKCGYYPDRLKCNCTEYDVNKYMKKISGPLLDRIDIAVHVSKVKFEELNEEKPQESSEQIRERVKKAREIQRNRYVRDGILCNGELTVPLIKKYCILKEEEMAYMSMIYEKMQLSTRAYYKILKLARTIADLQGKEQITKEHIAEAVLFRPSFFHHTAQ